MHWQQHRSQCVIFGYFSAAPFTKIVYLVVWSCKQLIIMKDFSLCLFLTEQCIVRLISKRDPMIIMKRFTNKEYKKSLLCEMTGLLNALIYFYRGFYIQVMHYLQCRKYCVDAGLCMPEWFCQQIRLWKSAIPTLNIILYHQKYSYPLNLFTFCHNITTDFNKT